MKSDETSANCVHAVHCCKQASLAEEKFKKHWIDLAESWMVLDDTIRAVETKQQIINHVAK